MHPSKELIGPAPSPEGKLIKITLYIKKLPEVSDDYFHAYWANNHVGPAVINPVFKEKVVRYNQYHITPEHREMAKVFGFPVLDYDGVAEAWVHHVDDWIAAITEPTLAKALEDDDKNFIQQPIYATIGFDHLVQGEPLKLEKR